MAPLTLAARVPAQVMVHHLLNRIKEFNEWGQVRTGRWRRRGGRGGGGGGEGCVICVLRSALCWISRRGTSRRIRCAHWRVCLGSVMRCDDARRGMPRARRACVRACVRACLRLFVSAPVSVCCFVRVILKRARDRSVAGGDLFDHESAGQLPARGKQCCGAGGRGWGGGGRCLRAMRRYWRQRSASWR